MKTEFILDRMIDHGPEDIIEVEIVEVEIGQEKIKMPKEKTVRRGRCEIIVILREYDDVKDENGKFRKEVFSGFGETIYCRQDHSHSEVCAKELVKDGSVRKMLENRMMLAKKANKEIKVANDKLE